MTQGNEGGHQQENPNFLGEALDIFRQGQYSTIDQIVQKYGQPRANAMSKILLPSALLTASS